MDIHRITYSSQKENEARKRFYDLFESSPIPENEVLSNLGLFIKRQDLSHILFMHELYQKIINVHGVIFELGVRWGQNLALFESFRGAYEPFNHNRKIIGFDTFEGFPAIDEKDGHAAAVKTGGLAVSSNYEEYLERVLQHHEQESPISHICKFQLIKGDATVQVEKYLHDNPETMIALAYFDFDIYQPTRKCLELIRGHITKGTVLGFDELNVHDYPGETLALKEVLGLDRYEIRRSPLSAASSYLMIT
jgi:hypothetical protein